MSTLRRHTPRSNTIASQDSCRGRQRPIATKCEPRHFSGHRTVTAAVLAALYGLPALSQEEPAALQEIVVTATRREASVQDIPASITAVTGTTLERGGIEDIAALAQSVAGVAYADKGPYGGINGSTLIIRGLNSEDTSQLATASPVVPPVATYVDETPLFFNLRLQDLNHVEILRGPQGTLYGSGSLGGTIRFVQNAPDPKGFDAKVELGGSDTAHAKGVNSDVSGMFNMPLSPTFAVRINGSFNHQQGFIDQPNLFVLNSSAVPVATVPGNLLSPAETYSKDGVNNYTYRTARVAALWKPDEKFRAQLSYYYQLSTGNGFPYVTPQTYGINSYSLADYSPATTRDKVDLAALTLEYDVGFATLTSASSWAHHNNQTFDDITANYQTFSFYNAYYGANPRAYFSAVNGYDDKLWSQEIRLASKSGGVIDWVAGAFFKDQQSNIINHDFANGYNNYYNACIPVYGSGSLQCGVGEYGPINNVKEVHGIELVTDQAYAGDFQTHFRDLAVFGEVTAHITPAWSLTGGTRAFKQTVSQAQQTALMFIGPDFIANESLSAAWRRALWKVNTSYRLNTSNLAYATWSQGFRRGGVNALPPTEVVGNYVTPPALSKVNPDTANNYEIGFKGTLQNRFRFSAAIFDIEWKDIQEGAFLTPLVLPGAVNVGNGYSRGLELEFLAAITDHFSAQLGYTYDETKLTSLSSVASVGLSVPPPVGSPLPGTPKTSLALGFEYGHVNFAGGEVRFAINGHYRSSVIPAISASVPTAPGYTMFGARVGFAKSHWVSTLYVDNVTNALGVNGYTDPAVWGYRYSALISRPRTVGLTVSYSLSEP